MSKYISCDLKNNSQQSKSLNKSSDCKIVYIIASMLKIFFDV